MIRLCFLLAVVFIAGNIAPAADLATTEQMFREGNYAEAEASAAEQVENGIWNERWSRALIRSQLVQGKYKEAANVYQSVVNRYPSSVTLRMLGIEALRFSGAGRRQIETERALVFQVLQSTDLRNASRDNLIAAGRYFTEMGEDARDILEMFYDRVRQSSPNFLEAYIATAELAIEKGDFNVAGDTLQAAERIDQSDPRTAYLMAKAFESSDAGIANSSIQRALEINPNHVPSLLFLADAAIDREFYDEAEKKIASVLEINPNHPQAWAFRAVLAHLNGEFEKEKQHREKALGSWAANPAVDSLIGLKLSQKYRFAEGAEYQQRALAIDANHTGAQFQLAQDLLRLGNDEQGWNLASRVAEEDPYNVVAHNLATLRDRVQKSTLLEANGIVVKMDPLEAKIYGGAVLELLSEAREVLCAKYDVEPNAPIVVEIFPEQKDFAIRTFGLPGGAGFLGVCFGRVITANSPASQGERPANWKSVLWHEFCHVVTLEKTNNRMPRWLSEGISVYEERCQNKAWGESMTATYRTMLLDDNLTPVSGLSAAFLSPPSPIHLQFAYYQSSLVVEFLVERHGVDSLKGLLDDLGDGLLIHDAISRNVGPPEKLDAEFAAYACKVGNAFAPDADWSDEGFPQRPTSESLAQWLVDHPHSYKGLRTKAASLVAAEQYQDARVPLEQLSELEAMTAERGGPMELLADVYKELGETELEREIREQIVSRSADALPSLKRLMELEKERDDWDKVALYAKDYLAIQPLLPFAHDLLAEAAEMRGHPTMAIHPLMALLEMDPVDPAGLHFQLAQTLSKTNQNDEAKRHALLALEEAPRYRQAHRLLLTLVQPAAPQSKPAVPQPNQTTASEKGSQP
ncbi:tetratricopeptide repeat protein [Novipirellula herctigrandis]|uniref:tetratricopeptide repeat protein n=1 Tax=Novipirellula herctigrandis TaxID=2527986 RepID=UPI003AF3438B